MGREQGVGEGSTISRKRQYRGQASFLAMMLLLSLYCVHVRA